MSRRDDYAQTHWNQHGQLDYKHDTPIVLEYESPAAPAPPPSPRALCQQPHEMLYDRRYPARACLPPAAPAPS
eukprot:CAMPEP_0114319002 /NCGR_PEP_ID=MMETSP0059-20121206/24993_1 /TAXON_ID=36894 /ORGANISM="Pyramimonas parkeae, Strain CCMP726" /LENGTH=72 /DNA_ID=CAMNT_0001445949 /DNA_START=689 /DNA_END=904 /DNA_ORIENTATION=+